jgi:hypothetical protein
MSGWLLEAIEIEGFRGINNEGDPHATGSTQAFSGPSLLGVVSAIDSYTECFMEEHPTGSGNKRYYRSLAR